MRSIGLKHLVLIVIVLFTASTLVEGQQTSRGRNPEKSLFGKSRKIKTNTVKVKEPKKVVKAKKDQEKKQEQLKKDYNNYVEESKKSAYDIQSPAVKERMKQNQKDISDREKSKKKGRANATRSGARKYKK